MPRVKIGDDVHQIPWNPDVVAGLIFQGVTVLPDHGIDEATHAEHQRQLETRLRRLWGNQNVRTMPGRGGLPSWKNEDIPEITRPPLNRDADFLNVLPNPYLHFQIRQVPNTQQFDPAKALELASLPGGLLKF